MYLPLPHNLDPRDISQVELSHIQDGPFDRQDGVAAIAVMHEIRKCKFS